jgi:hypothetical protein
MKLQFLQVSTAKDELQNVSLNLFMQSKVCLKAEGVTSSVILKYHPVQKVSDFIFSRKNQWRQVGKSDHSHGGGGTFMSMRDLLRPRPVRLSLLGS